MCYLISVAITGFPDDVTRTFQRHGLLATPNKNPSVLRAFGGTRPVFDITVGGCSCDIHAAARARFDEAAERARFAPKGWSLQKIERALKDRRQAYQRVRARAFQWNDFTEALASILGAGGKAALLSHFYSGNWDEEAVPMPKTASARLTDLAAKETPLAEDTVMSII